MSLLIPIVTYLSILVFVAAVAARFWRIRNYPLNIRWEVYPLPSEGERARYGGSKMEEVDYWEKNHKPDRIGEVKFMIPEMLFISSLFEHNRKLWYRSFPFHFGLYVLAAFVGLLVFGALLELGGMTVGLDAGALGWLVALATIAVGLAGMGLTIVGALGLLAMRLTDEDMKPYTNFSHFFNLLFILLAVVLALLAWIFADPDFALMRGYVASLLTFQLAATPSALVNAALLVTSLLIAYIPLTHMSHFFVKWFTWHKIRWDDTPNVRGGRIEKMIEKALGYPVSWSADHIAGDGKRTWADVATEEIKTDE